MCLLTHYSLAITKVNPRRDPKVLAFAEPDTRETTATVVSSVAANLINFDQAGTMPPVAATVDRLAVSIGSLQFDENVTVVHEQSETAALDDKTLDGFQRCQISSFDPHRAEAIEPLALSGTDIDRGRPRVLHWRPELIAARTSRHAVACKRQRKSRRNIDALYLYDDPARSFQRMSVSSDGTDEKQRHRQNECEDVA